MIDNKIGKPAGAKRPPFRRKLTPAKDKDAIWLKKRLQLNRKPVKGPSLTKLLKPQVDRYAVGVRKNAAAALAAARTLWAFLLAAMVFGGVVGAYFAHLHDNAKKAYVAVNGEVITKDDLFNRMQDLGGTQAMQGLVKEMLLSQFAKSKHACPTDQEVAARYLELSTAPNFDIILAQTRRTAESFKDHLPLQMAEEALFEHGASATDDDVQKYYSANINPRNPQDLFYRPASVTASDIEVPTSSEAELVTSQLNNGAPFSALAQNYSIDANRASGGQLPPFALGRSPLSRTPAIEAALFNTAVGGVYGPVVIGGKYWIFKVQSETPSMKMTLAQALPQAKNGALLVKGIQANGQTIAKEFADFKKAATVQVFAPGYASAAER